MNRRITKTMALEAASDMKEKVYSKMIDEALEKVDAVGEELARKYIPSPVIACINEYSTYFNYRTGISITAIKEQSNGWPRHEFNIPVKLSFKVPYYCSSITVEIKEYEIVRRLYDNVKQIENVRDKFGNQMYEALWTLRTEKAVEKELPEAMKYLKFPVVKAVPMPVFTGLREIIGMIKEDDHNQGYVCEEIV